MIPRERAIKIMEVIKETGAKQRAMFVNSLSKKAARPGSRLGSIIIFASTSDILSFSPATLQKWLANQTN